MSIDKFSFPTPIHFVTKLKKLEALDRGELRHPLYGNRKYWFSQSVRPGFWSRPIEDRAPQIRDAVAKEVGDGLHKLVQ